jgi:hypothetical protein
LCHGNRCCKRASFCVRPLQGAVQSSQQLVELRLLLFGKGGHQLVNEVLVGRHDLIEEPPPLLG